MSITKKVILAASVLIASTDGFSTNTNVVSRATTSLNASNETSERRTFLRNIAGVAFGGAMGLMANEEPASASYSAYTNRENDWKERKENGEIQYSNARDLKRQLREVAPMNAAKSQVFCPNGPSAAVSPLMENKCNDQMAMPSVFGRSDDIMGNSIPGRNPAYIGGTSNLSADTGGFPTYK